MSGDKAKRGRSPGFKMTEEHRNKIRNSHILNHLIECAEGEREMTSTQAQVGLGLLKKVMPDMTAAEIGGPDGGPIQTEELGQGAAKLAAFLDSIAERSGTSGEPDAG